jgi:ppGpp synthetase/RelA/SpoT-type nucleotidyltranferase
VSAEASGMSKSQLDKLGSRLRNSIAPDDEDLVLLDQYRERFKAVNDAVVSELGKLTTFAIESRHKSVPSIVAKLRRRQPARLSAIQDLAGARIIVPGLHAQDDLVRQLVAEYPDATLDDKRERPTYSYRAVHVIIHAPLPYEVQIRTEIQHAWAQLSERLADRHGFELKYGGGPPNVAQALAEYSEFGALVNLVTDDRKAPSGETIGALRALIERLPTILKALEIS